jgi:hypothetical protein
MIRVAVKKCLSSSTETGDRTVKFCHWVVQVLVSVLLEVQLWNHNESLIFFSIETRQVYQSKCLRVLGDFLRRTSISYLHAHLQMTPIRQFIFHLTDKFFASCPAHSNPLIRNTWNYTLEDLHRQYTNYRHKHIKHILFLLTSTLMLQCFFSLLIAFSLP